MNNQVVNLNEVLANFQKSYPNLAGFKYDQGMDALVYEGNYIRLNGYMLSRINPTLFSMSPDDIFTYLKNGFYYNTDENGLLNNLLSKLIITDEEAVFIKNYIKRFITRYNLYLNNKDLFDGLMASDENINNYIKTMLEGKKIIDSVKDIKSNDEHDALSILANSYRNEMENVNSNSLSQGLSLTRTNPNYGKFKENEEYLKSLEDKQKFGMAGFTRIILIISSAVAFGMYLALKFMSF